MPAEPRIAVRFFAVILALSTLPPAAACAQAFRFESSAVGLRLGFDKPTGSSGFDDTVNSGPAFGLRLWHFPVDWIGLGLDLGYASFGGKKSAGTAFLPSPGGGLSTSRARATSLMALGRINLLSDTPWTPYVLGGAGLSTFSFTSTGGSAKSSGLSLAGGGGVEAFVMRNASVALEARFEQYALSRSKFAVDAAEAANFSVVVNWWFRAL